MITYRKDDLMKNIILLSYLCTVCWDLFVYFYETYENDFLDCNEECRSWIMVLTRKSVGYDSNDHETSQKYRDLLVS